LPPRPLRRERVAESIPLGASAEGFAMRIYIDTLALNGLALPPLFGTPRISGVRYEAYLSA
jgi:hypothetical protein